MGLVMYDFEERDLFQRSQAEMLREKLREEHFGSYPLVIYGTSEIRAHHALLNFDSFTHAEPLKILMKLLCRAFGYRPLHPEANRLFIRDPLVTYGALSLGGLRKIIEDERTAYTSRIKVQPRLA
jgi:hypothetical protein